MNTGEVEQIEYEKVEALGLYFYVLRSNSNSIQCLADISVNDGFDIICRDGSIG